MAAAGFGVAVNAVVVADAPPVDAPQRLMKVITLGMLGSLKNRSGLQSPFRSAARASVGKMGENTGMLTCVGKVPVPEPKRMPLKSPERDLQCRRR
jgi:hypothetical protein